MKVQPDTEFRHDIVVAAEKFFGRKIVFDEKALRAFEVHRRYKLPAEPMIPHIWAAIEREVPLLSEFYHSLEIPLIKKRIPGLPHIERKELDKEKYSRGSFEWNNILKWIFGANKSSFTKTTKNIKLTGLLGVSDILLSILEYQSTEPSSHELPLPKQHNNFIHFLWRHQKRKKYTDSASFSRAASSKWLELLHIDHSLGYQQLIVWNDGIRYRVSPFSVFGGFQIDDREILDGTLWRARGNIIQPIAYSIESQVKEFEELINKSVSEKEIQEFLEINFTFLEALGPYAKIHSQIILHHDDGSRLIPDFFLEHIDSDFCDICDLKLPNAKLVRRQKNRIRFSDAVREGIAQLSYYRDWFEDKNNREKFQNRYGLRAYRPRVVLIIGRQASYYDDIERLRLESELPNWLRLITYDRLLKVAGKWKEWIIQEDILDS